MLRWISKILYEHSSIKCLFYRSLWVLNSNREFSKLSNNIETNDKILERYFEKIEAQLHNDPSGCLKQIPNLKLLNLLIERKNIINNLNSLVFAEEKDKQNHLETESSIEWKILIKEERKKFQEELQAVNDKLIDGLSHADYNVNNAVIEVKAGIGGKEAMLFAKTLFDMYTNYVKFKNWKCFVTERDGSELGGLRHGQLFIEGSQALNQLYHESGVHRVQRVPLTKPGRVHTSTVTVAVLPHPTEYECSVNDKDIVVDTFRSSGAGGQHVNKTDSAVRITHIPSNTVVECQTDRSQIRNKQQALQKLRTILYERHMKAQEDEIRNSRKLQIGSSARSDKVRTYNYTQDRITDHRLNENIYKIDSFIKGGTELDSVIQKLINLSRRQRIEYFLWNIQQKN